MNTKNDVEVIINGKQYTMSGYESSEYLQKIAAHINEKFALFKEKEGYSRLDTDMKYIMLAINLSDDYHKAQNLANDLRIENEEMGKEIFDMKHELISMQAQMGALEEKIKVLEEEKKKAEHDVIRLETELGTVPDKNK